MTIYNIFLKSPKTAKEYEQSSKKLLANMSNNDTFKRI